MDITIISFDNLSLIKLMFSYMAFFVYIPPDTTHFNLALTSTLLQPPYQIHFKSSGLNMKQVMWQFSVAGIQPINFLYCRSLRAHTIKTTIVSR